MTAELSSAFADRLRSFVASKRAFGRSYSFDALIAQFDRMASERFPNEDRLTKEICLAWAERRPGEGARSLSNRVSVIREFARYLAMGGEEAYLTPRSVVPAASQKRRLCHIFDDRELGAFFSAADSLEQNDDMPLRHLVVPVYYRLLACCGMRPREARVLSVDDVDLVTGEVFIAESKNHKERIVSLPDDLLGICRRYRDIASDVFPKCGWFLPNADASGCYHATWPAWMFNKCWEKAGGERFPGPKPCPYDFRHTFATRRIASWMAEGRDVEALIPLLMDFMGHSNPEDTYYYFHLAPIVFPSLSRYGTDGGSPIPEATDYDQGA